MLFVIMNNLTIFLNLCDGTWLKIYNTVEAYKICMNIINHYCGWGSITSKSIKRLGDNHMSESLEISVSTNKKYDDLIAILKICFDQDKLLVEKS